MDDSAEAGHAYIFSAIAVPTSSWNEVFGVLRSWRAHLRDVHGIPVRQELHATQFLSGRGSLGANGVISRHKRAQIFHKSFQVLEYLHRHGVRVFNVCHVGDQDRAFERLLNRINRTMQSWDSYAHLICDEGKEAQYTKLVRRMRVFNPIPSRYGVWLDTGQNSRNITLDRIIEDPQFKDSKTSYYIQMADFVAYGLLRREFPTPRIRKYGNHKSFDQLDTCLTKVCNRRDPKGIIR